MNLDKIGKFIYKRRKELSLTQNQLGEMLGISGKAVSKWERGVSAPDISVLKELSEALGITISELLAGEKLEKDITNEKVNDITVSTIGVYSQIFKKKYFKLIFLFCSLILLITTLFSVIYMIANYNQCFVYGTISKNEEIKFKGIIASNQKESSLFITDFVYNGSNVGTEHEFLVNEVEVLLSITENSIFTRKYKYDNKLTIDEALKEINIVVNESQQLDRILQDKRKLKEINIILLCRNDEEKKEFIIPIKVEKRFSNNRIIY